MCEEKTKFYLAQFSGNLSCLRTVRRLGKSSMESTTPETAGSFLDFGVSVVRGNRIQLGPKLRHLLW